jgi:hypothetical protein
MGSGIGPKSQLDGQLDNLVRHVEHGWKALSKGRKSWDR